MKYAKNENEVFAWAKEIHLNDKNYWKEVEQAGRQAYVFVYTFSFFFFLTLNNAYGKHLSEFHFRSDCSVLFCSFGCSFVKSSWVLGPWTK